ncbi:MAG: hypothetical protein V7603_1127 [Micromonosporaceae bacterium]
MWGSGLSLTGLPLLVVCWIGTKLAIGLTIVGWRHGGPARVFTRTVSILLCEAVALFTLGVVANRAFDLYPSWAALLHPVPEPKPVPVPAARLDGWLHGRDLRGAKHGVTFAWEPPGWGGWGLAGAPTVFAPQAYFDGPALRFPVIVVAAPPQTGPAQGAWNDRQVLETMVQSRAAVVVFLRLSRAAGTAAAGAGGTVTDRLPYALSLDVRVSSHGWALVGIGADAALALTALAQRPERYQDGVVIADGAAPLPPLVLAQVRHGSLEQPRCLVARVAGGVLPPAVRLLLVGTAPARLSAAMAWIYPLLPAPLNPPEIGPIGIPPKPRPRRPHPRSEFTPGPPRATPARAAGARPVLS